ncbi:MAG: 50S ribosomal protein L4 [Candidatus Eiseniibacteriota bacterium]|nr:MAG: 50S ribosomal protein L4 [Candidatus Eisenbacteria bacterium]
MISAKVFSAEGEEKGTAELPESLFGSPVNESVLHEAVRNHLANRRHGTASTKSRADVKGSGIKPWRQKGTGRARAGSRASPIWVGGGRAFGPKPRDYGYELPKKVKRLALRSALSLKAREEAVMVVDPPQLSEVKTKEVAKYLERLGLAGKKCLLVTASADERLLKSVRNIPKVRLLISSQLNAYALLDCEKLLLTPDALQNMKEVFSR